MWTDLLLILFTSCASALIAEGLSWLLIYRTAEYQKLKATVDSLTKKLERKKEAKTGFKQYKPKVRRIDRYEENLKAANRSLSYVRMKSTFAVMFTLISLYGLLNSGYDGIVVARLPFEPMSLVQRISHRNLRGHDYYECSMAFFYALCSVSIRANIQKLFGNQPATTSLFGSSPAS